MPKVERQQRFITMLVDTLTCSSLTPKHAASMNKIKEVFAMLNFKSRYLIL